MDNPQTSEQDMQPLAGQWRALIDALEFSKSQLISEIKACLREFEQISESQLRSLENFEPQKIEGTSLELLEQTVARVSRKLVEEHYEQWEQRKPFKRAMKAVQTYGNRLEDAALGLPKTVQVKASVLQQLLEQYLTESQRKQLLRLSDTQRVIDPSALVLEVVRGYFEECLELLAEVLAIFTEGFWQLRHIWDACYDFSVGRLNRVDDLSEAMFQQTRKGLAKARELIVQAEAALDELPSASAKALVSAYISNRRLEVRESDSAVEAAQQIVNHLIEQFYMVDEELRLLLSLLLLLKSLKEVFCDNIAGLRQESERCVKELDKAIAQLSKQQQECDKNIELPDFGVVPAQMRLAELEGLIRSKVAQLPSEMYVQLSITVQPPANSKLIEPQNIAIEAIIKHQEYKEYVRLVQAIEKEHTTVLRQIEQACEVISFGLANRDADKPTEVTREAFQNALSLLEFHRKQLNTQYFLELERVAAKLLLCCIDTYPYLRQSSVEAIAESARKKLALFVLWSGKNTYDLFHRLVSKVTGASQRALKWTLTTIGWSEARPPVGHAEITVRPMLPEEFVADPRAKLLPAIYKRLFHLEPLKDPKFLIGRDEELAAIAKARQMWVVGRPTSLLVVGERGSGKSSLLNCAVERVLAEDQLVRLEFGERLVSEQQLEDYLCGSVKAKSLEELKLLLRRHVVILEELERTFLRRVGQLDAVRALIRLISSTCFQTFWIVSINQVAYKFLDAVVGLGGAFSHRINAARASKEALREAIMVRHRLSGLRLYFAQAPVERKWIRQRHPDAESSFFEALARESNGLFRTAFEIWLAHIERIEGGACHVKPIVGQDLEVIEYLGQRELFSLLAIMQHGSLTVEEHAKVFYQSCRESQGSLDRLCSLELIEPDPSHPGYRIRPEVIRLVRQALYLHNLL
ncbi:MAG: ATP-binding protein [Acidobacteriota bacterium]|nr:ATP-binding protein [Blastocatellia bacterium]MDW8412311.1 ATP-binding protein [Acidobacteriota bacterium]